jgi:hypothetical protein
LRTATIRQDEGADGNAEARVVPPFRLVRFGGSEQETDEFGLPMGSSLLENARQLGFSRRIGDAAPPRGLRRIRELVRAVLTELGPSFGNLYSSEGRPSIPPEQLLSALLLQVFYGIRSERQLMEQLRLQSTYRWFAGLAPDDPVWDATPFTENRKRLQQGDVFQKFMTKLQALGPPAMCTAAEGDSFPVTSTFADGLEPQWLDWRRREREQGCSVRRCSH